MYFQRPPRPLFLMKITYVNSDYVPMNATKPNSTTKLNIELGEEPLSDAQLWEDFKKGSQVAYAMIYKNYAHDMYRYGLSLYNNPSFVKDCIHDIFIEIWHARCKLAKVQSIKSYLLSAIRNKVNKEHRRGKLSRFFSTLGSQDGRETSPETILILQHEEEQQQKKLQDVMKLLSSRQREAIFLKFYQGLSYEEIASVLSITVKGAYKLIGRAIHVLRKNMLVWFLALMLLF